MKILLTLASLDIGGAETHVTELAVELKKRGHKVIVASEYGVYVPFLEEKGIRHYSVPLARRSISDMLAARRLLKKIIRAEKPDIVHAHARIPAFIISTLQRCASFVFVTTVHGAFDTSFLLRRLSGWGCKTLAVSEDLKEYLLKNYKVSPENVYTSINGISSEKFNKDISCEGFLSEFGLSEQSNRICFVSRLSEGICSCAYMLVEQFEYIAKNAEGAQLVIVGGGELFDDLGQKAESVNERLGYKGIILTGPRTDVNEIIASAKVCVGVSRAILEPMSMEKLCVVAGDPGYIGRITPESLEVAINCNFTCRGCEKTDARTLANEVVSLLNMAEADAEPLKNFAGQVVKTKYSIDKMVSDNEQMYKDAMSEFGSDAAILGYYGYGNCGDDALLEAILSDIKKLRPYFSPTVLSYKPASTVEDYGVKAVNRFDLFAVSRLFKRTKLFIAGGGSLVQDITSTKSLLYYLFVIVLAKRKGLPVMLYGNGIGPINRKFNRYIAARVLNMADVITLRDYDSLELLGELGVKKPEIRVTADPALSLECNDTAPGEKILEKYGVDKESPFFCMSVRKWRNMKNGAEAFAGICDTAYEKYGLKAVILPMQYSKDIQLSLEIMQKAKHPCTVINESLNAEQILSVLKLSECAVAVRLHMLIFGSLLGKAVLGVDYDPKVSSFLRFVGQESCLTTDRVADGSCVKKAEAFFENYKETAERVGAKLEELKAASFENAQIAVELIENER